MKLLILTQKIDEMDPVLGFFHGWVREFAQSFDSVVVICLQKGQHTLPSNVKVISLGKEVHEGKKYSKLEYTLNFFKAIWAERKNYSSVFVHMNQEYILLGGVVWKLLGKKIYMWRNHHAGSLLTDIAAAFCKKVFCTSKFSYTARYQKTVLMPIGIDMEVFKPVDDVMRIPKSILSLGRISPSKSNDLFVDAVLEVHKSIPDITASVYGDPLQRDEKYYKNLKIKVAEAGAEEYVTFHRGIANTATPYVYSSHEVFVNLSSSGMYDKTIFEAMSCGTLVLASNDNLKGIVDDDFIFKRDDPSDLVDKLVRILTFDQKKKDASRIRFKQVAEENSLKNLVSALKQNIDIK